MRSTRPAEGRGDRRTKTGTAQKPKYARTATSGRHKRRLKQILLIDDDAVQLGIREAVLKNAGFQVCVATTAESALAVLRAQPGEGIGAVITDHIMPRTSGAQFVRELRQYDAELPVIVVTGMAEAEDEYAALGVVFRQKPLPPQELIRLARSFVPEQG